MIVEPAIRDYYDRRAGEYDDWWLGTGLFASRIRPGWNDEVAQLAGVVAGLEPCRVLDVACGTGFLTRHLRGEIIALDQSAGMLEVARTRLPHARILHGDATSLPFAPGELDRVFTSHFYGHLLPGEREAFVSEARRTGRELVVVDAALRPDQPPELWQERVLDDGSRHSVYKRYFAAGELAAELGGGRSSTTATGSSSSRATARRRREAARRRRRRRASSATGSRSDVHARE